MGGGILSTYDKKVYDSVPDLSQAKFIAIYPNLYGFSAVKTDKSVIHWGLAKSIETKYPYRDEVTSEIGDDIKKILSNDNFFFGIKNDASVKVWGEISSDEDKLKSKIESVLNIKNIYTAGMAITLEDKKGDLYWIPTDRNYENPKLEKIEHSGFDNVFTKIYSNEKAFAGITLFGRIISWGDNDCGGSNPPGGSGYIAIYSTYCSFVAVKADGTYRTWGKMGVKTGTLNPKQIEITPFDFSYDAEDKILDFSVRYTAYERKISSLTLVMYHENKWGFNGLSEIKGLRYPPDTKPRAEPIKGWKFQDYGEFDMFFYDLSKADLGPHFYDGEAKTDTAVYLTWSSNLTDGRGTFESSWGFLESAPDNGVKLFKTSFKLNDDINFDKSCINFFVGMPSTGIGRDYETRLQSLVITKSESGELILELGKQYSRFPGDDQAWSPCKANPNTSNSDNSGG
jgi:hypothetical protein